MTEFLVEQYVARSAWCSIARCAECARTAAEQMTLDGTPVRFVRSIFVPEDETCFYLFEATSAESVAEAARRAAIAFDRVVRALPEPMLESGAEWLEV